MDNFIGKLMERTLFIWLPIYIIYFFSAKIFAKGKIWVAEKVRSDS